MKYTLMNGARVDNLQYRATGKESWEQSQYFWYNGKKTCELYNTETGEIKWFDANGKEVLLFERVKIPAFFFTILSFVYIV